MKMNERIESFKKQNTKHLELSDGKQNYWVKEQSTKFNKRLQNIPQQHRQKTLEILFGMYINIILHLSQKQLTRIAEYQLNRQDIKINNYPQPPSFMFKIRAGNNSFVIGFEQYYVKYLWEKGTSQVLHYFQCFLQGVMSLQKQYIFHQDLDFRNSIKVVIFTQSHTGNTGRVFYDIIDFDHALHLANFQSTNWSSMDLIKFWMKCQSKEIYQYFLFPNKMIKVVDIKCRAMGLNTDFGVLYQKIREKVKSIINNNQQAGQKKESQILIQLQNYSRIYHRVQICHMLLVAFQDKSIQTQVIKQFLQINLDTIQSSLEMENMKKFLRKLKQIIGNLHKEEQKDKSDIKTSLLIGENRLQTTQSNYIVSITDEMERQFDNAVNQGQFCDKQFVQRILNLSTRLHGYFNQQQHTPFDMSMSKVQSKDYFLRQLYHSMFMRNLSARQFCVQNKIQIQRFWNKNIFQLKFQNNDQQMKIKDYINFLKLRKKNIYQIATQQIYKTEHIHNIINMIYQDCIINRSSSLRHVKDIDQIIHQIQDQPLKHDIQQFISNFISEFVAFKVQVALFIKVFQVYIQRYQRYIFLFWLQKLLEQNDKLSQEFKQQIKDNILTIQRMNSGRDYEDIQEDRTGIKAPQR